jgi:hypothetical protein
MKVSPVAGPIPQSLGPDPQAQAQARERALAKLVPQTPPQREAVSNPNQVSLEELSAIQPKLRQSTTDEATEVTEEVVEDAAPKAPTPSEEHKMMLRREKALRIKAQQIAAQEKAAAERLKALEAREAALTAKDQTYSQDYVPKSRLQSNTFEALAEIGLTAEQIAESYNSLQSPLDPRVQQHIAKLEARLAKLDEQAAQSQKAQENQQAEAYQAAVKQIEADAKKLVYTDPQFEAVKATNSVKDVVELIEKNYAETGEVLSVEEAARMVQDHLEEELSKYSQLQTIQKRLQRNASKNSAQAPKEQSPATPKQPQQMRTLTNASASTRQLSARERALLAFKGELK